MAEQFSIPTVGDLIAGKYRVEEELGRGAYGVVFRADQEELGRHVAVKTLLPQAFLQQDIVQRFHREAQLISRLDHPNIIRLFDYGVDEGLLYMAVEYVEGPTLMDLIDNDAPLDPDRVRKVSLQMLDALVHAHSVGIVHRDLKPENIVLLQTRTTDGREYEVVKILDFGISKLLSGENDAGALKSLTQDGTVLGTPHYMSPENIVGDPIDHRADLYAFGVILFELLTGEHPFDAPSPSAVMVRHLRDALPDLPPAIAGTTFGIAIERCMEKQPWDRIGSAEELIEILEAADASEVKAVHRRPSQELRGQRPTEADETTVSAQENKGSVWFLVGVVAVALIVVAVGYNVYREAATADAEPAPPDVTATKPPLVDPNPDPDPPDPDPEPDPNPVAAVPDLGSSESIDAGRNPSGAAMVFGPSPVPDAGQPVEPETPPKVTEKVDPKPRPKPTPKDPKPEEQAKMIDVRISATPEGTSVTLSGTPVGRTPFTRAFEVGKPVRLKFTHIGYKDKELTLTPGDDTPSLEVKLEHGGLMNYDD